MYTLEEIAALRKKCLSLKLDNAEILLKYTDAELQAVCNGIGPEFFPDWCREIISNIHPTLQPVAFIHDVEWHESDGEWETFYWTNREFESNGIRAAFATYKWYDPRRYIVCFHANRLARVCHYAGFLAYQQCHKERDGNGTNDN